MHQKWIPLLEGISMMAKQLPTAFGGTGYLAALGWRQMSG